MIDRTRITVDQATREVLDQLDAHMAQKPTWAEDLHRGHDALCHEIRKDLRDGLAQVTRQSETVLTTTGRSTQAQIVEQSRRLDALTESVQAIGQQFAGQQDTTAARLTQIAACQTQADAAMNLTIRDLQETKQLITPMTEQLGEIGTQISWQKAQLEYLQYSAQQQQAFGQELLQTLKSSQAAQEDIRAEQLRLRDALQCLSREIDAVSRPWWQKVFNRNSK